MSLHQRKATGHMPAYEEIGDLFRVAREDAGLSQQALAERASVGVSTVSRLELGVSVPRSGNLAKLAHVLGVTPERLETAGEDAAADILRASITTAQRDMSAAFRALVDAEVKLTSLGFEVTLSQPSEGTLLLSCKVRSTPVEVSETALPATHRRARGRLPPPVTVTLIASAVLVVTSTVVITGLVVAATVLLVSAGPRYRRQRTTRGTSSCPRRFRRAGHR